MINIRKIFIILFTLFEVLMFSNIEFLNNYPENNQENVSPTSLILKWQLTNTENKKLIYDIYLGESKTPPLYYSNIPTNIFPIKILKPSTTYYWKIIAKDGENIYESPIWSFKTRPFDNGELIWVSFLKKSSSLLYSNNIIFNIYDNNIEAYNSTKNLSYTITEPFLGVKAYKNNLYLLKKNSIKIFSTINGSFKKNIKLSQTYKKLKIIDNDKFLLYTDNQIDLYQGSDKYISLNFNEKISNIFLFDNAFIVNLKTKIIVFDYDGKIIKEYKVSGNIIDLDNNFILLKIENSLFLQTYDGRLTKIDDNIRNAHLLNDKIFIEKNNNIIIYNILTKSRKSITVNFDYNKLIAFNNELILLGNDIKSIDYDGKIIWSHSFQNEEIVSNIIITDYNTISFSIFDGSYYKIVEIYDNNIKQINNNKNSKISFAENNIINNIKNEKTTSLPTPTIINPKTNEKINSLSITLEWILPDYDSTTVKYEIQLKEISSGLIKNKNIKNITSNKLTILLEPNTKYIWKVIAMDNDKKAESNWSSFSTTNFNFILKRIKLADNQMVLDSKMKNDKIYFTGYTTSPNTNILKLLYGNITTSFVNLKAWDFGNAHNKFGSSIDITDDGTILIGGYSAEKDLRGDMLLYSLTEDGKINWNIVTGSSKRDSINDLYYDKDENYIYYIGSIGTDNMEMNIQFSKYSPKGFRIWSREFGGYDMEFASSIKRIDKYSFLLLGSTKSFGEGGYDYYVIKTNELGEKIWDLTIGTSKDDFASDLLLVSKNEYIILGTSFRDTLQPFLAKIDNNGFKIFAKIIPFINDVNLVKGVLYNNYIYSIGWFRYSNSLKRMGIITKFDLNGNLIFAKIFDIDNQDTVFTDLIIKNNKFFLIGFSEYPEPNSRDIIFIQTTEDYILNNFKDAK